MSKTYEQLEPVITELDKRIKTNLEAYPTDTAEGAIASFLDGADAPLKSLVVNIEPVQSGEGDPSPTNIRPISGWTGMNVTKRGINIWDEVWEVGGISSDGSNHNTTDRIRSKNYIPVVPGETYYYKATSSAGLFTWGYDKDKLYVGRIPSNGYAVGNNTVTIPDGVYYIRIVVQPGYGTTYNNDISINYPATETDYHPYSGESIDITFPIEAGTIYGGSLDVLNGILTVDRKRVVYDGTNTPWTMSTVSGIIRMQTQVADILNVGSITYNGEYVVIGNIGKTQMDAIGTVRNYQQRLWYYPPAEIDTVESFNAWLAENNLEVVYMLAEPVTYKLTPHEVKSLLGQNNLWADTGDTTLEYRADTSAYIAKKIAEAISALS